MTSAMQSDLLILNQKNYSINKDQNGMVHANINFDALREKINNYSGPNKLMALLPLIIWVGMTPFLYDHMNILFYAACTISVIGVIATHMYIYFKRQDIWHENTAAWTAVWSIGLLGIGIIIPFAFIIFITYFELSLREALKPQNLWPTGYDDEKELNIDLKKEFEKAKYEENYTSCWLEAIKPEGIDNEKLNTELQKRIGKKQFVSPKVQVIGDINSNNYTIKIPPRTLRQMGMMKRFINENQPGDVFPI